MLLHRETHGLGVRCFRVPMLSNWSLDRDLFTGFVVIYGVCVYKV